MTEQRNTRCMCDRVGIENLFSVPCSCLPVSTYHMPCSTACRHGGTRCVRAWYICVSIFSVQMPSTACWHQVCVGRTFVCQSSQYPAVRGRSSLHLVNTCCMFPKGVVVAHESMKNCSKRICPCLCPSLPFALKTIFFSLILYY